VFGLVSGNAPDRFVVGLAVLGLLAEVAAKQPLLCLVDDAQWLDEATSQVLGFVGRRLLAESVALILAVREPLAERLFPDLPDLTLTGLDDVARALLTATVTRRLDERIRDRLIADTGGNLDHRLPDSCSRGIRASDQRPPGTDAPADAAGRRRSDRRSDARVTGGDHSRHRQ
jgi:hypothetical protein